MQDAITKTRTMTMLVDKLRIDWVDIAPITISEIKHKNTRIFLQNLKNVEKSISTHVYLCSDSRNEILRVLLSQMPSVAVYNSAGNVIYNSFDKPTIVIGHGCEGDSGCGAVDYVKKYARDKHPGFKHFIELVKPDTEENAVHQLLKVKEDYRAGVLYFDHQEGRVRDVSREKYPRLGSMLYVLEELKESLNGYTQDAIEEFAKGQNPEIIFVNNLHSPSVGYGVFQIELQRNSFDGIIIDSMAYAMSHALKGGPSFQNTHSAVLAFRAGRRELPQGLESFLNNNGRSLISDYIKRGGSVYFAIVGDNPSEKRLFQIRT